MKKRKAIPLLMMIGCLLLPAVLTARSWEEIQSSGILRVLTAESRRDKRSAVDGLHRVMMPIDREEMLLRRFAARHGLAIVYLETSGFAELFPMLEQGRGDLISSNLAYTPQRAERYLLSAPFEYTREIVFTSTSSGIQGNAPASLTGKTGWLLPGTTYAENFRRLSEKLPALQARELSGTISHEELIEQVAVGRLDYSVLNECDLDVWLSYREGIRKLFPLRQQVPLVFAAARENTELIRLLNLFMASAASEKKAGPAAVPGRGSTGDLPAIRKRGYLRMLTTNELFCCYLQKGQLCGFEYELAKRFADGQKLELMTVIPARFEDLPRYLAEGKGDFIAANVTLTPERVRKFSSLTFCAPYGGVTQVLVGRPGEKISKLSDLANRTVHVRKSNSYYQTLQKIRQQGIPVKIAVVEPQEQAFQTLKKVSDGTYRLTVVDDTFLQSALNSGLKLRKLLTLSPKQPFAWVVRKNNPQLAAAIREYFRKENRSTFYNLCYRHYYGAREAQKTLPKVMSGKNAAISPYDALFQKYGRDYQINWCLLAAQAYQESRFDTLRINHIGATGLMQVLPATAKDLGIRNLTVPDNGIRAGTRYLARQRSRFGNEVKPLDQLCFALASYNAGYGHVADARRLAVRLGLNPNVWFGHTEKALALLEEPRYAAQAKFGYCRASETIPYVRSIIRYADSYQKMVNAAQERAPQPKVKGR